MVVSRRADGRIRVCFDEKDLNKAIMRCHRKTPTLEELTHKFSGAKVSKKYHDRGARDLKPLQPAQKVRTRDHTTGQWWPGIIENTCEEPRSYIVQIQNGSIIRRNRAHIRDVHGAAAVTNSSFISTTQMTRDRTPTLNNPTLNVQPTKFEIPFVVPWLSSLDP